MRIQQPRAGEWDAASRLVRQGFERCVRECDVRKQLGFPTSGRYRSCRFESKLGFNLYHFIQDTRGYDPSGLAITAGLKTYF